MRKFLIILFTLIGLSTSAETQYYRASSYAYKQMNNYGYWADWSDWINCNVAIEMDMTTDLVTIYSNRTQMYYIYSYEGEAPDGQGGQQAYFKMIDQDGDYGVMRLRVEANGNSQIYIEFADIMWVYNVRRTY